MLDQDQALKDFVRVSINLFAPRWEEDFDMRVAESITSQSLARCYGKDVAHVKQLVRKLGDYGDVAVKLRAETEVFHGHASKILTLDSIVEAAEQMSDFSGDDSV